MQTIAKAPAEFFTTLVQLSFWRTLMRSGRPAGKLTVGARDVPLQFARHPRARRYVMRLTDDGTARITVPRSGSIAEAHEFARRNIPWLQRQFERRAASVPDTAAKSWKTGTEFLFRGESVKLEVAKIDGESWIRFADVALRAKESESSNGPLVRRAVELHLWRMAAKELPRRLLELASQHGFQVHRVSVRNQRSRWGSCSRRGTISLNWRLIQVPPSVRDYICLHELAHLREMNHSPRYWRVVQSICPNYPEAERWLKANGRLLRH